MSSFTVTLGYSVRNFSKNLNDFKVLAGISNQYYKNTTTGITTRSPKQSVNEPDWQFSPTTGLNGYFKKHNGFRDQELHNRLTRGYVLRQGTDIKYYTTTFDPSTDPLFHEDNNRTIDRVFDIPVILSFQPEVELYAKFGIQQLDESEIHIHMLLFLELNYQSLRRTNIVPNDDPSVHNPVYYQRGYEAFRFHGYTFDQIGPKAGDKVKIEAFNTLYEVESVKDATSDQHRWRKYFWKVYIKAAQDLGQTIGEEVTNDAEQNMFINGLIGLQAGTVLDANGNPIIYPFDVSNAVDELKKDVLFRPVEVSPDAPDISEDPNSYPGGDFFGSW